MEDKMNKELRLSVIMPMYNAADSLEKSVGSLFRQGLDSGTFEVLLINDGSKDNSLEVCRQLAEQHPEIRVVDKPNGGVSSARNRGLEEAKGEWVAFLDADDYLLDDGYKTALVPYCDRKDVDVIHYFSDYDFWPIRKLESGVRFEGKAWDLMREGKEALPSFCWLYFYRKSFLDAKGFCFKKYIVGEDQLFSTSIYLANPYILTVKANIYRYVVHDDSATTRRTVEHSRKAVLDYISSYADILAYAHEEGADRETDLWNRCKQTLDSKKVFAVSRMLSARYKHREWKDMSKFCRNTQFAPMHTFASGIKNKLSVSAMNGIMSNWFVYSLLTFLFNRIVEPYILPKMRVGAKQ